MIIIKRANARDPWLETKGRWRRGSKPNGVKTATLSCPECGLAASLSNHKIDNDGKVSPSLVCPLIGCTFHDHIVLENW